MAVANSRARIGLGTKIIFTQSGFTGEIIEQITMGADRGEVDVTHMGVLPVEPGTIGNRLKIPLEIAGIKDMSFSMHLDEAASVPPIDQDPETIIIQFRRRKTQITAAQFSATGFLKDYTWTIPMEGKMIVACVVAWTGNGVFTRAT